MERKYILNDELIKNLDYFLNKVTITGHQERNAMNQIIVALSSPIKEEQNNNLRSDEDDC